MYYWLAGQKNGHFNAEVAVLSAACGAISSITLRDDACGDDGDVSFSCGDGQPDGMPALHAVLLHR